MVEYDLPTIPPGKLVVVIDSVGITESVKVFVAIAAVRYVPTGTSLSCTCTVNVWSPATVGVPVISPAEVSDRPGGIGVTADHV